MQLKLLEQPKQEIITLEEAKNYLRINQNCDDNLIKTMISATREAMETILQKSLVKQKWMYKIMGSDLARFTVSEKDFMNMMPGTIIIPLPKPPVISIEKITIRYKNGSQKILTEYQNVAGDCFCVKFSITQLEASVEDIEIVYYTGIVEEAENIPYQLKLSNLMLVANSYNNRFSYNSSDFMPASIEKMLSPFRNVMRVA